MMLVLALTQSLGVGATADKHKVFEGNARKVYPRWKS